MMHTDSIREKLDNKDGLVHNRVEKRKQFSVCAVFYAAEDGFKWSLMDS